MGLFMRPSYQAGFSRRIIHRIRATEPSGYHRRSRIETKMHCRKWLGWRLSARDFNRRVAGFQIRVPVRNGFTALGIPVTKVVG